MSVDRLQLIYRYADNFGLDLNMSQVEAALASQEADYVLDLLAAERAKTIAEVRALEAMQMEPVPALGFSVMNPAENQVRIMHEIRGANMLRTELNQQLDRMEKGE